MNSYGTKNMTSQVWKGTLDIQSEELITKEIFKSKKFSSQNELDNFFFQPFA